MSLGSKVNYYHIFPPFASELLSFVDKMFTFLIIKAIHVYFRNKNPHNSIIINIVMHLLLLFYAYALNKLRPYCTYALVDCFF